ncbi:transcriptional regulator [Salmonella enterica subsp. enterica]|nr:transcriptional regulator [Salmonella enterica subsp. enterica]
MTEAQRHQILLDMLAQLGFVTVENVIERLGISRRQRAATSTSSTKAGNLKKCATAQRPLPNSGPAGRR